MVYWIPLHVMLSVVENIYSDGPVYTASDDDGLKEMANPGVNLIAGRGASTQKVVE